MANFIEFIGHRHSEGESKSYSVIKFSVNVEAITSFNEYGNRCLVNLHNYDDEPSVCIVANESYDSFSVKVAKANGS